MSANSTERFSNRVDDYVKFRPTYPPEVLQLFKSQFNLSQEHTVVDVGSGTGISSEIFLKNGNPVIGIEPNDAMRKKAETLLASYKNFKSIKATSENTSLEDKTADLVVAAQAFHWFDPIPTQAEFKRVLKPHGFVAILFNDRKLKGSAFLEKYEELLCQFGTDYKQIRHNNIDTARLQAFLGNFQSFTFPNNQDFDYPGLLGRLSSSSYVPAKDDPKFQLMEKALVKIFEETQINGHVKMEYTTQVFCSEMKG